MTILNEFELRVLGSLVEKQISTPDYYPITLNALTNACNQKNHRDPVVSYTEADVTRALESLRTKQLAFLFDGATSRVPKYGNFFQKVYNLEPGEVAILCVLMLRGPQTPGELRSRTPHLHAFASLHEVEEALQKLTARPEPLAVKLPRLPGTKEARYAHLLGGDIPVVVAEAPIANSPVPSSSAQPDRVAKLEAEVESLKQQLGELKTQFDALKQQLG